MGYTQIAEKFERSTFSFDNIVLPYRFYSPSQTEKDRLYPLILTLHGAGERGNNNERQIRYHKIATIWAKEQNQNRYPCFILSPQCPLNSQWVNVDWGSEEYSIDSISISLELQAVKALVDSIVKKHPIDTSRIYITGLSMGGFGTWDFILRYPHKFAAAIPMSGAGDPCKAERINHLPIWAFHGAQDITVPTAGSRKMISALLAINNNVFLTGQDFKHISAKNIHNAQILYTEYPQKAHVIWGKSYTNPLLIEWLFKQRRK